MSSLTVEYLKYHSNVFVQYMNDISEKWTNTIMQISSANDL
jgi:hypothetical protein